MNERDVLSKAKELYGMSTADTVCNVVSNGLHIVLTKAVEHTSRVTLTKRVVIRYRDKNLTLEDLPNAVYVSELLIVDRQNTGKGIHEDVKDIPKELEEMLQELSTSLHPSTPTPRRFIPRHNEKYFMVVFSSSGLEVEPITFNSKNTVHKWAFLNYKIFNSIRTAIKVCENLEDAIQQSYMERLRSM